MINHGLMLCSFNLKKKYSRDGGELQDLNRPYENGDNSYDNALEMFVDFFDKYSDFHDDQKLMKMFSIDSNSVAKHLSGNYVALSAIIQSGAYGLKSKMTNRNTKEVVYTRQKEDADVKPFNFMVLIPKDLDNNKVTKGIFVFLTIGTYGVKTISTSKMNDFFSNELEFVLETKSISPRAFVEKLFDNGKLNKITLIRNRVSSDSVDNIFLNAGREEKVYIRPRLTDTWKRKLFSYIDGNIKNDIFEVEDNIYQDIKLTFKHGGRTKTIGLLDIDKFSIVEDVPKHIYDVSGELDGIQLIEHMKITAEYYMEDMVFY